MVLSVHPSVCHTFSLCFSHHIIMKFSGIIAMGKNDVHAKDQGQKSKVEVTEVKANFAGKITSLYWDSPQMVMRILFWKDRIFILKQVPESYLVRQILTQNVKVAERNTRHSSICQWLTEILFGVITFWLWYLCLCQFGQTGYKISICWCGRLTKIVLFWPCLAKSILRTSAKLAKNLGSLTLSKDDILVFDCLYHTNLKGCTKR